MAELFDDPEQTACRDFMRNDEQWGRLMDWPKPSKAAFSAADSLSMKRFSAQGGGGHSAGEIARYFELRCQESFELAKSRPELALFVALKIAIK